MLTTVLTHINNQLAYYEKELRRYQKIENLSENDKGYLMMLKIMVRDLKKAETKLKVKVKV